MPSAVFSMNAFVDWNRALLDAAGVTLQIAAGAFVLGIGIGLAGAAAKLSGYPALARLADLYTLICRAVPELLLILLLFYAGSDLIDLLFGQQAGINGFVAAVLVLGIVQGAYATEIIRGAFLAIPHGQIEAAKAFALPRRLIFQRVILPAMLPYALAGIANLWLVLIKDTSLISVVGYSELLLTAKQAAGSTKQYFIYYTLAAAYYFAITMVSTSLFRCVERRFRRWMPARSHA